MRTFGIGKPPLSVFVHVTSQLSREARTVGRKFRYFGPYLLKGQWPMSGSIAEWLARVNQQVDDSNPGRRAIGCIPGQLVHIHTHRVHLHTHTHTHTHRHTHVPLSPNSTIGSSQSAVLLGDYTGNRWSCRNQCQPIAGFMASVSSAG